MSRRSIGGLSLSSDKPTKLNRNDLHHWIIWQFPQRRGAGLCGAVHPPEIGHGWIPALIMQGGNLITVHAHIIETFGTPADAAGWLLEQHGDRTG